MREEILPDAEAVARRGAEVIAEAAREAVAARGRFLLATSGGSTPWRMLRHLAEAQVPWPEVHLFQVDERVAPAGSPDRNLTNLHTALLDHLTAPPAGVHAMPVELPDLDRAAAAYAKTLRRFAGSPPVLDMVHLGLGEDGHTASLVPGDPVLEGGDVDVAGTGPYAGHRRLTLTVPLLDRARQIIWVVTGASKAPVLEALRRGDRRIPAGRVRSDNAVILSDAAAGGVPGTS
ncbi:MAG: 6-phosphogluconolactonase [Gemmatimonadota bacterium]|nr:6-phosphogluconolactonase [Gemmatimonadota bacterium]